MSDNEFFGGRRRRRGNGGDAFSPYTLFASGEQGVWYDPSDLTPEKVSWRRNLLTYSQDFENAAWTKSNASILSNLALYSQDFDNAAWTKGTDVTVTANTTTAPDGTTTADSVFETANTSTHVIFASISHSANIATTSQIRVKPNGRTRVSFYSGGGADLCGAVFDLVGSGSVVSDLTAGVGVLTSRSISALTDGWYLLTVTGTRGANTSTSPVLALHQGTGTPTTAAPSYTGDVTKGVFLWGAQFLPGSTAQTYTRSLATAAPIQFADPLGGTLADKLVEDTNLAADHRVVSAVSTFAVGTTYTSSLYAKAAERSFVRIFVLHVASTSFTVNLADGSIQFQSNSGNVTASATLVGDGWYRIQYTYLATVASANAPVYATIAYNATGTITGTGDGTSGVYFFGAQAEQASTASAYQRITNFNGDFSAAFPNHALYQESVGPSPVTALGQSVGLVLDKRLGPPGPELVANGTFANGTGWTFGTGWELGNGVAAGISASGNLRYAFTSINGATYRVQFDWTHSGGTLNVRVGGGTSTTFTTSGTHATYVVGGASTTFGVDFFGGAAIGFLDNVSVRLVSGNHAIQATSAARPTLQARSNLLIATEQFDTWSDSVPTCTVTANSAIAPDGTSTADLLTATGAGSYRVRSVTFTGNGTKCISIFMKLGTATARQEWKIYDSTTATVRGSGRVTWTGGVPSVVLNQGSGTIYPVEALPNGWYRILLSTDNVVAANSNSVLIYPDSTFGTGSILVWGAQVEDATVPTTYQRVTTATDYADVGLPRNLTFDGIDDSLATAGNVDFATWTVGTRRNLLTVPTMFDDAGWSKTRSSITPNAIVAPDGTLTGDKLVEDTTAANSHFTNQTITLTANTTYTLSVYAKAGERNFIALQTGNVANWSAQVVSYFNLTTGVVTASTGPAGTMVDAGNGWWRCSITGTFGASTTIGALNILLATTTSDAFSYTGNGTSGVFLWGAQLEVGSTATAFQDVGTDKVTLFSGVTKLSDAATGAVAELSTALGSNNGTFLFYAPRAAATPGYQWFSKGTTAVAATVDAGYAAPVTNVVTGIGDIGADVTTIRINASATFNNSDQGTGTYGSYLLYVGRRASSSLPFNGRLFQLVIRGAATDSVTVGNAERWVGQLTGVAL